MLNHNTSQWQIVETSDNFRNSSLPELELHHHKENSPSGTVIGGLNYDDLVFLAYQIEQYRLNYIAKQKEELNKL